MTKGTSAVSTRQPTVGANGVRLLWVSSVLVWLVFAAIGCGARAYAEPSTPSTPSTPWGVSPSATLSNDPSQWLGAMAEAGATTVRGYDYRKGASGLSQFRATGIAVTGTLMWSSGQPRSFPVNDLDGFRRYVIDRVKTFGPYIKHWEVWNEPPNGTRDTSAASYAKIVATAYDAAKSVDPKVQIGLAAKSVHIRFLADAIAAGARDKFDYISLHPYETAALLPQGWELPFLGIAGNVRAMLHQLNRNKEKVPLWFTEVGVETDELSSRTEEELQAETLLKIYVLALAQGINHIHWFDPKDSEGKHHGLLRSDGSQRPAFRALSLLTRTLGNKPQWKGFVALGAGMYGFLFAAPTTDVLIAWTQPGAAKDLRLAHPATLLDFSAAPRERVSSVKLSSRPLLLTAASSSETAADWCGKATTAIPSSWSCESSDRSVHLVAGEPACGIHMVDAPAVTSAGGKAELSLTGRSAARFAVDPQRIGYSHQALEVTAVVRGHGRGEPGFSLKYEAERPLDRVNDYGMVGAGAWNRVQGDEPQTLQWTLKDARFVGKYGVNLAIECDSAKYCDFSLLELRVRKRQ